MMKERELCSAGGCRRSFDKTIDQIVVYEAVIDHVHVEVVLLRHELVIEIKSLPQNSLITQQHALALTLDSLPRDHNRPTAKLNEK